MDVIGIINHLGGRRFRVMTGFGKIISTETSVVIGINPTDNGVSELIVREAGDGFEISFNPDGETVWVKADQLEGVFFEKTKLKW